MNFNPIDIDYESNVNQDVENLVKNNYPIIVGLIDIKDNIIRNIFKNRRELIDNLILQILKDKKEITKHLIKIIDNLRSFNVQKSINFEDDIKEIINDENYTFNDEFRKNEELYKNLLMVLRKLCIKEILLILKDKNSNDYKILKTFDVLKSTNFEDDIRSIIMWQELNDDEKNKINRLLTKIYKMFA